MKDRKKSILLNLQCDSIDFEVLWGVVDLKYVFHSQDPDFEERLKEIAEKENATLSFDGIAEDFTNQILKSQPANSECLVYGPLAGFEVNGISIMELFKDKTLGSLFILEYIEELKQKGEFEKFQNDVHSLLPTVFRTNIQKVFKLDDIKEAIAFYKENSSKGKSSFETKLSLIV